jgi:hypothetical protein
VIRRISALALAWLLGASSAHAAGRPIAKGPWVQRVTSTSALVRVEVDPPAGVSVDVGGKVVESREALALHSIELSGLNPGTRYAYSVKVGGTTKAAAFVTAPRDDSDEPFRFLVYGDNRTDDAAHAAVVRAMVPVAADFLVHTGDFVGDGGSTANWQTFFDIEAPLLGSRCMYSAVGNHELTDGSGILYARFFGPTDRFVPDKQTVKPEHLDGTYRWGNTRFFFVNSMVSYKATADRAWLDKALADADAEANLKWRIVVLHHGPWSSGPHHGNARLHDAGVVPLLKEHKVDLVVSGHDHIYERGVGDGLPYVVSGGGGAPVYKVKTPIPESRRLESSRHFVDVSVTASSLQLVATRSDGSTIERCGLTKAGSPQAAAWDCDGAHVAAAGGASAETTNPPSSSSNPAAPTPARSRCACDVPGAPADPRGVLLVVLALVARASRRLAS